MKAISPKPRKCCARGCGKPALYFAPQNGLKKRIGWCSDACGAITALDLKRRKDADKAKRDRAEHRERKKAIERPKDLIPRVQDAFNAWVRERDHGLPCISCGRHEHEIKNDPCGGTWDCGHFLTRGAHPELRFEPLNAHRQCKRCNSFKSGNATRYEEYLIARIGADKVAWLKGPHEPKRYTVEQLREMLASYNADRRRIQKERELRGIDAGPRQS